MIPECSNLVYGMILGYTRSGTALGFRGQRSRSPGGLMLTQKMPNIFRTGRPTKFKLGTQTKTRISDKRRDLQGQRKRSQGHVTRLTGVGRLVENETS